ncbi:MAG: lysoplasmalogenase family protein [Roseburia sp.]|nr:lysoplasmalogenase family protein [Roseburia sp.]
MDDAGVSRAVSGGVLFLLSDIVLLLRLFGIETAAWVQCVNRGLYYCAQGCLAASLSAEEGHSA